MVLPSVAHLSVVFICVIVLCMVFHGEVISASHHSQPSQFFWIDLCSDHLSAMRLSPDQPASVCFAQRIDLLGEVFSCFGMVVPATFRSASAIGSLTCGSFQHGSLQRGRLPWRAPLGFSAFFSQPGLPGLISSTRFFSLRVILLGQLFCSAWFSAWFFSSVWFSLVWFSLSTVFFSEQFPQHSTSRRSVWPS